MEAPVDHAWRPLWQSTSADTQYRLTAPRYSTLALSIPRAALITFLLFALVLILLARLTLLALLFLLLLLLLILRPIFPSVLVAHSKSPWLAHPSRSAG